MPRKKRVATPVEAPTTPSRRGRRGGGSGDGGYGGQIAPVNEAINQWNTNADQWAGDAINYGQNNPFTNSAAEFQDRMLEGNAPNRWSDDLYGNLSQINGMEGRNLLSQFLGGGGSGGGRPWAGGSGWSGGTSGFGGSGENVQIPDSTMGKGLFADTAQWFLDRDARLNPEDDPTLKPYVDAIKQEALESYQDTSRDLSSQLSGKGLWGGSLYNGLKARARDDANENTTNALAGVYKGSRDEAINKMMEMLGLGNQRDIAQGNINAELAQARMAADASRASSGAAARSADQDRRLQAIGMMMQGDQFGLGLKGNMAEMLQNGQLGAMQTGLGYGELGMGGYDRAANFGSLGLGALNQLSGNISNYHNSQYQRRASERNSQFARERYENQLPWDNANQMINMLRNLGELNGDYENPAYLPEPQDYSTDPWIDALLAGGGEGMSNYFSKRNR